MDLNELNAFVAVAEHKSFSKAAVRLHLTQPAISKRISSLEADSGVRLFDRVGRRVHLTDSGRLLLPRAREMLTNLADTRRLLRNTQGQVDGVLRMATSHHIGLHRLAPVLRSYKRHYPKVRLDIHFEDSEAAQEMVRRAESELAIVTLDPNGPGGLTYRELWDDPLWFVAARDHELANRQQLGLAELAASPAILPGLATYTGRIVRDLFQREGLDVEPEMETNYLETIGMLVEVGLGWSVLPGTIASAQLTQLDVVAPPLRRTLGCVTNPRRTLSNAAAAFVENVFADLH